ncbi:MAG: PAS domain S-box protein [Syntrophaceae bacterium]|nr:PAS domain S-box protein [Syntrophaceae bacterium]
MEDEKITREQLIEELSSLRLRVSELDRRETERQQERESLRNKIELAEKLMVTIPDIIVVTDMNGRILFVNHLHEELLGYPKEEVIGENIILYLNLSEDMNTFLTNVTLLMRGELGPREYGILAADGRRLPFEINSNILTDKDGSPYGIVFVGRDITKRKKAQEALRASEERYRLIFDNIEDAYYEVDLEGNTITCNESAHKILGYTVGELKGMNYRRYMSEENARIVTEAYGTVYRTCRPVNIKEFEVVRKDGAVRSVEVSISLLMDSHGQPVGFQGIIRDITDRKEMEERIISLSMTDQPTGLYNRRGFLALAEQHFRIAERLKTRLLLLFADLDGLKQINDTMGHKKGDEAILEAATILKEIFRESDIVARVGGDEFVVLAYGTSAENSDVLEKRLQQHIDEHNAFPQRDYEISMSVGIVYKNPDETVSIDELMSQADAYMYEQKRRKKAMKGKTDPSD